MRLNENVVIAVFDDGLWQGPVGGGGDDGGSGGGGGGGVVVVIGFFKATIISKVG